MRILYSLPFWPYLYTPWLFREMSWMRKQGHELAIVSLNGPPGPAADLKELGLDDVPVLDVRMQYESDRKLMGQLSKALVGARSDKPTRSLSTMKAEKGLRQGLHEWSMNKRVLAFVRKHKCEVIDAHWAAHSAMLAREIKNAMGIPFAVRFHGGDLYRNPSPALQEIVDSASAICPVSQFLAGLLQGERPFDNLPQVPAVTFDKNKLRVCHNALPVEALADEPVEQSEDEVVIGMVGRLDPEKRHCDLIRAVGLIAADYPHARVKLIGGGALEADIRAEAEKAGIADRLEITGSIPWTQVIQEIRTLHIYAHGAAVEGCSLAVLEGQSQGLPMLLSRTGAAGQCVTEGVNGYLFDSGDVQAQADGLRQLIEVGPKARREMGQASLDCIREHFLLDHLMSRYESILDAIRTGQALPEN